MTPAPARPCCAARWWRATIIFTRWIMTAAANGPATPSCARAKKSLPFAAPTNCLARGYDRTGFFEVDTGEQRSWTVQLTDTANERTRTAAAAARAVTPAAYAAVRRRGPHRPEPASDETSAPRQDRRHAGARILRAGRYGAPVQRRRRRLPHQYEPHQPGAHARAGRLHPRHRARHRPADRHPGRPAGSEAAARHLHRRLGHVGEGRDLRARQRSGTGRCHARFSAASGDFRRRQCRGMRCCSTTARCA